jgi:hypothetical protein
MPGRANKSSIYKKAHKKTCHLQKADLNTTRKEIEQKRLQADDGDRRRRHESSCRSR